MNVEPLRRWSSSGVFLTASVVRFLRAAGSGDGEGMLDYIDGGTCPGLWDVWAMKEGNRMRNMG